MRSRGARLLHRFTALAYVGFGGLLFLAPAWAAERFPWTVSPFVAITIGSGAFAWVHRGTFGRAARASVPAPAGAG